MAIEVEQKFPVSDLSAVKQRLDELGHRAQDTVDQRDVYFAHPHRDFAASDEALRLRHVGDRNYITYKGPKLDASTKSRREIEITLPDGRQPAADAAELLRSLGFERVAEVSKRRMNSTLRWQDWEVAVSLDEVAGLGNFVELEIAASESQFAAARDSLVALADHLDLADSERRSYLELLEARDA